MSFSLYYSLAVLLFVGSLALHGFVWNQPNSFVMAFLVLFVATVYGICEGAWEDHR